MKSPEHRLSCLKEAAKANLKAIAPRMGSKWAADACNRVSDCGDEHALHLAYGSLTYACTLKRLQLPVLPGCCGKQLEIV